MWGGGGVIRKAVEGRYLSLPRCRNISFTSKKEKKNLFLVKAGPTDRAEGVFFVHVRATLGAHEGFSHVF